MTFNRLVVAAGVAGALVTAGPTRAADYLHVHITRYS